MHTHTFIRMSLPQRMPSITDTIWSYLDGQKSLKFICAEDIQVVEKFPRVLEGGYARVQKAKLRGEDGTERLVALKVLKYDPESEQSHLIKVSNLNLCV